MKWFSKNAKPPSAGFYYVRQERNIGVRYFEDTKRVWWLLGTTCEPNDSFYEWLNIEGVSDKQRS